MTIQEMASRSGYSRQRLNKLVDAGFSRGVRRKPSGRLEVFDQELAARWCDHLRKRKDQRHQRNLARKEKRADLILMRQRIGIPEYFKEIAPEVLRKATELWRSFGEDKGFPGVILDRFTDEQSWQTVQEALRPIDLYREAFAWKGRKQSTRAARAALFDYEVCPERVPWFRSWEDIARDFGCTHAALSAAAKQLPPELRRRLKAKT
jgi:hypothetical protein